MTRLPTAASACASTLSPTRYLRVRLRALNGTAARVGDIAQGLHGAVRLAGTARIGIESVQKRLPSTHLGLGADFCTVMDRRSCEGPRSVNSLTGALHALKDENVLLIDVRPVMSCIAHRPVADLVCQMIMKT